MSHIIIPTTEYMTRKDYRTLTKSLDDQRLIWYVSENDAPVQSPEEDLRFNVTYKWRRFGSDSGTKVLRARFDNGIDAETFIERLNEVCGKDTGFYVTLEDLKTHKRRKWLEGKEVSE